MAKDGKMQMKVFVALLVSLLLGCANGDCTFNLDTSSPTYPPHIVDSTGKIVQPTLQNRVRVITLSHNQQVTVACEGTGNVLTATSVQFNNATCASAGFSLQVGTRNLTYSALGCSNAVKDTIKETGTCFSGGTQIEVGWQVGTTFINQLTICHVKSAANTLYSIDTVSGANVAASEKSNLRPAFRKGPFFAGINVDTAYSQAGQTISVASIVGSSALAAKYIDVGKSYYLARGHLAPDGDFIDSGSQDATYYYINCAPQWQSFNNGNWKSLEFGVRNLAIARGYNIITYSGTYQTLTLADANGVQKPIYLAKDANNNDILPVPKYYWKVIHDPVTNTAAAVIGINNPHLATVTGADVFCADLCNQITWQTWSNRFNIPSGYMFCCTVQSLASVIPHAPNLGNLKLLV